MEFYKGKRFEKIGEKSGYVFSYFVFTTVLYLLLVVLSKMPESWSYFQVMGVTAGISLVGIGVRRLLK